MNDLIKINTDGGKNTVNARDLHEFLESKQEFANWIKARVEDYGFKESIDFLMVLSKSTGGRPSKEYHISIGMAKELSMVERNEKGKQARQYFIECERRAKDPAYLLNDPAAMRQILLTYTERVITLETENKAMAQKVIALDRISTAAGSICITDAAKSLQVQPKILFQMLSSAGWIYRRAGGKGWIGYQNRLKQGVLEHKVTVVTRGDGSEKLTEQALVTPKGLALLATKLNGEESLFAVGQ